MSYLKLRNGNVEASLRTLRAAKFHITDSDDGFLDVDVTESSVYLKGWSYDGSLRTFVSDANVNLGRGLVLVTPNPVIGEILGSQPSCPVTIESGYFGSIDVGLGAGASDEAVEMIQEALSGENAWLVRCTYLV